ncbi:hypothetical protein Skr01_53930 [Sphaerisporangium krabiense]|nr:hypothetical protein Skr01_53930 [Sphaerisporangium krabiense]
MTDGAQADLAAAWARTAAAVQDAAHHAAARDAETAHVYAQARRALFVDFDEHGERGSYHGIEGMTLSGLESRREKVVAGLGDHARSGAGEDAYAGVLDELLAAVAVVRERAGGVPVRGRVFVLLESIAACRRGGPVRSADRHRGRLLLWAGPPDSAVFTGPAFAGTRLPPDAVGAAADDAVAAYRLHAVRVPPPDGETVMLAAPACSGVLLHELCGHLLEADVFRHPENRLRALMGRRLSHPGLTVVDDSAAPSSWASLHADDHGNPGRAVTLLDSGHVAGTLTSGALTSADGPASGAAGDPGGHAHRTDYRYAALPRMTTLSVLPGPDSAPGVLADVRDGVYAEAIGRATCDPVTGRFVAQVDRARRIRDGRLCEPLSPIHVTGDVVQTLSSIRAVCDDPAVYDTGCVKQQQTVANRNIAPTLLLTGVSCAPRAT